MKKSKLRKIIKESIKELMTEQVQDWGPGIIRHAKLYDCSNTYTQTGCDLGDIPSTGGTPNFNNLCLNITDPSGNPYLMGQVGPEIIFVEYQGQTYRMIGTTAGNQVNSCSAYGLGPVESATVVNGCALQSGGNGSGSQYFDPNNPPCSSTSTPCTVYGCTDPTALNYNSTILPNCDDNSCIPGNTVFGCTDPTASNYDPTATIDDGSCITSPSGCPGCNSGNHTWGNMQNWMNSFNNLGPFNSTNPNQPCNFLNNKIAQWTNIQQGLGGCNAYYNQLECKIKHATILHQQNNC